MTPVAKPPSERPLGRGFHPGQRPRRSGSRRGAALLRAGGRWVRSQSKRPAAAEATGFQRRVVKDAEIPVATGRCACVTRQLVHEQRGDDDNHHALLRFQLLLAARRLCLLGQHLNCNEVRSCHGCLARRVLILTAQISLTRPSHFVTLTMPADAAGDDLYVALRSLVRRMRYRRLSLRLAMFAERGSESRKLHWHGWAWGDAVNYVSVIESLALKAGFEQARIERRRTPIPTNGVDPRSCEGMSYPFKELIEGRTHGGSLSPDQATALHRNGGCVLGYVSKGFFRTPSGQLIDSRQSQKLGTAAVAGMLSPDQFLSWFRWRLRQLDRTR